MTADPERVVGMEVFRPDSAIAEGGEWLIVSITKIWSSRKGRRGVVDPDGGLTIEPESTTVLLLALPLVDEPKTAQPEGTLSMQQVEERIIAPIVRLNEQITKTNDNKTF
jgi:hypothetical protein